MPHTSGNLVNPVTRSASTRARQVAQAAGLDKGAQICSGLLSNARQSIFEEAYVSILSGYVEKDDSGKAFSGKTSIKCAGCGENRGLEEFILLRKSGSMDNYTAVTDAFEPSHSHSQL
jgi:hypothetical protein